MPEILSKEAARALNLIAEYTQWSDPKQIGFGLGLDLNDPLRKSYRVWNKLNNLNLIDRQDNSEQVRGEPRVHWSEYRINRYGRAYLESLHST